MPYNFPKHNSQSSREIKVLYEEKAFEKQLRTPVPKIYTYVEYSNFPDAKNRLVRLANEASQYHDVRENNPEAIEGN